MRDLAGLQSFSDHDRVERAIGRVGTRLREVEEDLAKLEKALTVIEAKTAARKPSKKVTPPKDTPALRFTADKQTSNAQSLTRDLNILRPPKKKKAASKRAAAVSMPAPAQTAEPAASPANGGSAASLRDLQFKR
ncbi:MAG: hypothetical protein M5R36_21915 [Deltaproteobacteria bacterium]|nr:hypothetical protein [Deltaproteobacteria bacterium]